VLYIDTENLEDDLHDRFRDLGVTIDAVAELDDLVYLHLPVLPPLDTQAGATALIAAIDAYEIRAGDVVILDSIQRLTSGKENDSDTIRAYYLHTGLPLKRRGLTVIRTDNTGKDADKGARGTSGKRDDVDVELIMEKVRDDPPRFKLKHGKIRLPDIDSMVLDQLTDEDGRIYYDSASDPFRASVIDAIKALDQHAVPIDAGERKAAEALRPHGELPTRAVLRVALKERKQLAK
jgi:hypothetical protein